VIRSASQAVQTARWPPSGRAVRRNRTQGAALGAAQRVGALIRRAMGADDVGELDPGGALSADARGGGRRQGHDSGAGRLGQIQGRAGGEDATRCEVQVARGGGEVAVAQQGLHRGQIAAGFEEMGGEGVAERMDAALLGDAGAELRHRVELLGDGDVDRTRALAIGEEPDVRGPNAPVRAPVLEQALGERHVTVLAALALADVDGHAVGVEVGDLEGDDLADAEAAGVGGRQQEPMPGVGAGAQQAPDFLPAQDVGQLLGLLGRRDVERGLLAPERHVVEKPERVRGLGARAPRPLPRLEEVRQVGLHLVGGELIGRPPVVAGQAHHLLDVRLVGAWREPSHGHVADHAGTQLAHEPPPSRDLGRRRL